MDGALKKMQIVAFKKESFADSEKIQGAEFNVQVNPETYSLNYKIKYNEEQASGTSGNAPKFDKVEPLELNFKFIFDSTGALPGTTDQQREEGIEEDIKLFKKVVFDYVGEIHGPPFLELAWGTLLFRCVLTSMDINYKLFRSNGTPVRAEVTAKFKELVAANKRAATEKRASPDLTHIRIVQEGDKLPLMCQKIYGDTKYYIEVARVNKIINFRNLTVGQRIEFPPLEKT